MNISLEAKHEIDEYIILKLWCRLGINNLAKLGK